MKEIISSSRNEKIRHLRVLNEKARFRKEENCFVTEGLRIFREIPEELLLETFISESFWKAHKDWKNETAVISDSLFHSISNTKTPQGILAVVRKPSWEKQDLLGTAGRKPGEKTDWKPLILVLENVQDPGNVGTMIRAAEGAGATGVILLGHTADPFAPKTIRSTMGSIFRVPLIQTEDREWLVEFLKSVSIQTYAAALGSTSEYTEADYSGGTAFLIGNEGNGLTDELINQADVRIRIPMEGQVESLNASIAASLLMYEAHRQRSRKN